MVLRYLYADDNYINLSIFTRILKSIMGDVEYKLDLAGNGYEAWELISQHEYNIIFTDIEMPILDGIGLIKKLKSNGITTRVVAVTSIPFYDFKNKVNGIGCVGYIDKAFMRLGVDKCIHGDIKCDNCHEVLNMTRERYQI